MQSISFLFLTALFIGSGPSGACGIWSATGIEHDHHEGTESLALFEEVDQCEQPSIPCNDANEELPDLQFSILGDSHKTFASPLIAVIPNVEFDFNHAISASRSEPLLIYDTPRPRSYSQRIVFCRFLI